MSGGSEVDQDVHPLRVPALAKKRTSTDQTLDHAVFEGVGQQGYVHTRPPRRIGRCERHHIVPGPGGRRLLGLVQGVAEGRCLGANPGAQCCHGRA
jgi:hypothetical protein